MIKIGFLLQIHFPRTRPEPVVSGQQEAGHEGVVTRCDDFSLRSSVAIPVAVAPALQSILKALSSYDGCTLIFLKFLLMSQPLKLLRTGISHLLPYGAFCFFSLFDAGNCHLHLKLHLKLRIILRFVKGRQASFRTCFI